MLLISQNHIVLSFFLLVNFAHKSRGSVFTTFLRMFSLTETEAKNATNNGGGFVPGVVGSRCDRLCCCPRRRRPSCGCPLCRRPVRGRRLFRGWRWSLCGRGGRNLCGRGGGSLSPSAQKEFELNKSTYRVTFYTYIPVKPCQFINKKNIIITVP